MTDRCLLDDILEPGNISIKFQPIFEISGNHLALSGVECLSRGPSDTNVEQADVLFEYARRKRAESLVDRVCVVTALNEARKIDEVPRFSLNVHASTLGRDTDFARMLVDTAESCNIAPGRITVEIIEQRPYWNGPRFAAALERLRASGVKIALDDFGLGESNYKMMLDSWPDSIKLDRYLVLNSHADFGRRAILESISRLATTVGATVVAEGVQNEADFQVVKEVGISFVQGFHFAAPMSAVELKQSDLLTSISPLDRPSEVLVAEATLAF